jgi:hypothetical protein
VALAFYCLLDSIYLSSFFEIKMGHFKFEKRGRLILLPFILLTLTDCRRLYRILSSAYMF